MNIAQVVATFPPYHGGMGYVCFHNSRELARRGHEVTVFTLDHGRLGYENDPTDFRIVRLQTPLLFGDAGVVPQLFSQLARFDVVHLHYPFFGGAEFIYFASLVRSQKYLLTYHMDVYGNTLLKKLLMAPYNKLFMRRIIQRADRIGALSMEHLRTSRVGGFVDWSKVVELPNGVDMDKFRPRGKDPGLLKRYGLEGKVVILFVGNLQPFKGLHLLIDAIAQINDPDIVLLVVGGGYGENEYRAQALERGVSDRVIFAGPKSPDADLPDHYNLGDFLVLPSTHSESFGLVVLEAMASGIPAIVSALPGPARLVRDGLDGLIVRIGDREDLREKVALLARDREGRARMGEAAREKVIGEYSWERIGTQLEDILHDILREKA